MSNFSERILGWILLIAMIGCVTIGSIGAASVQPSKALEERLTAKDEQLASYRLYSSEIAKSLVDLNKQLRESQAECERLERENMRLERRAMGLSDESEP